jgi:signal transduction histidine kinase
MSSRRSRTAAWRLSAVSAAAFAVGTAVAFAGAYVALSRSILHRGDAWLSGEAHSVAQMVATSPPAEARKELEDEVRELAQVALPPDRGAARAEESPVLFFIVLDADGRVWAEESIGGAAAGVQVARNVGRYAATPTWERLPGREYPVRVVADRLGDGRVVVVGVTPSADLELLESTRELFLQVWAAMVLLGFAVSWVGIRRVLSRVDRLAQAAAGITAASLDRRLDDPGRRDEISNLTNTFNAMLDRIQAAVGQVRTMADSLAHDLRSPVTSLRGSLEGALTAPDEAARLEGLAAAIDEVDRLATLIDSALETAEAEAGALHMARSRLDLADLAAALTDLFLPAAAERGIALELRAPAPVPVDGDPNLLRRLLMNLLDNATTHLARGCKVTVSVTAENVHALIEVSDNGPGFPPEVRARAFERLVHGPDSPGKGLGLSIVHAVAIAHGGTVRLEHPGSGGSRIRVILPASTD